jgi:hypothetical protein
VADEQNDDDEHGQTNGDVRAQNCRADPTICAHEDACTLGTCWAAY